jgi:hypothetical protein
MYIGGFLLGERAELAQLSEPNKKRCGNRKVFCFKLPLETGISEPERSEGS